MDPYTLIITSSTGSTIVPLGTAAAKNWQTINKEKLADPIIAQLRPNNPQSSWPPVQIIYPKNSKVAFKIITKGRIFTKTGITEEEKIYCLGWTETNKTIYMQAQQTGFVSMIQEEQNNGS